MSIITRTRPAVKPTRNTPRPAAPFGQGVLCSVPTYRLPCSTAELEWAAQAFAVDAEPTDAEWDRLADEAAMLDRYTAGFCC